MERPDGVVVTLQIVSLAGLVHYQFHMDKAPPQPPYQTHFCGESVLDLVSHNFYIKLAIM